MNTKVIKKINVTKIDILIFLIVFVIFGVTLLSFFPGILTSDGVDQIYQARNNIYSNSHPILHSFLIGNLTKLGGIWVPALFQIFTFSLIWTYLCRTIRKYNSSNKNKVFQIIFTIIICIIPVNFLYSITLWKDILYSYSILLLLTLVYIGIKENYKYNNFQMILISLSSILIMKFRHNGVPIGFLMFIIIFTMNFIKNKNKKNSIKFLLSFLLIFIILTIPNKIVNEKKSSGGSVLNSTKIYCMGALLNSGAKLEESEKKFINSIFDVNLLKENYDPYTGSKIFFNENFNNNVLKDEENQKKLDEIFKKYAKQNPKVIIKHFLNVNSIWWSIREKGGMHSVVLSNSWVSDMSNGEFDNHPLFKNFNNKIENYINWTMSTSFKYNLFYRPAVLIIISMGTLFIIIFIDKKKDYIIMLIPMFLNIGTYVFLISSQDHRYFYPNYMTAYILCLVCIETLCRTKINCNRNGIRKLKRDFKTLLIIPAYNEEDNILNTYKKIEKYNKNNKYKYDVIVINDGSKDKTEEVLIDNKIPHITLIHNLGIGGAVQTGYKYALENGYDVAVQFDGDGQHDISYVKKIINPIVNGEADFTIGSRYINKNTSKFKSTFVRQIGIKLISFLIKAVTGKKVLDTTSGFRACNQDIIEEFANSYPTEYPEPITTTELLKKGYTLKEVAVSMNEREAGHSSIKTWKNVYYMINVYLSIIMVAIRRYK